MSDTDNTQDTKQQEEGKVLSFEKQVPSTRTKAPKREAPAKTKQKITIGWALGMLILILIAISFVAAPAIEAFVGKRNTSSLVFGKYGKENITYAYGNHFFEEVQNYADQYKGSGGDQTQLLYQIWKGAYDSTVIHTAVNQLAKKAGIIASDEAVRRAIINSGAYHKDGKFDVETYQKASADTKNRLETQVRNSFPFQIVVDDIGSVLSSKAEALYVASLAETGRSFSYVAITPVLYPNEAAVRYALEHERLFTSLDISIISLTDENLALSLSKDILLGTTTFEEAAREHSLDSFAADGGAVGNLFYYAIEPNFTNSDDASLLLGAKDGDLLGPFESQGAWTIWRVNSQARQADYTDEATLNGIKAYIATYEGEMIEPWLDEFAQQLKSEAVANGLEEVALTHDLDLISVSSTPYNAAQSTYMADLSYTDPAGLLYRATSNTDVARSLYASAEHTLLDPIKVNSSYILVETGSDERDEGMGSYISMFYDYLSGSQNQQDLTQALYTSDAHTNDFLSTFFTVVLGQ
ncbi:MAG: SurA N-terminal domain-containing protein [Sphaerochaeta sp.]|jgi:parvulin-like peptidyl-prolyl isomerase|nr:SurA N-terminal domain-containing protein [Sphaerochaeta sp.]